MSLDHTPWDIDKFGEMVRYIAINSVDFRMNLPVVDKKSLHKLCYLSDFGFFELYGKSITGGIYVRGKDGPVPIYFDKAVKELITDGFMKLYEKQGLMPLGEKTVRKKNSNLKICNMPEPFINENEINVINIIIQKYSKIPLNELSKLIKKDLPWHMADDCQVLNYGFALYRNNDLSLRAVNHGDVYFTGEQK